MLTRFRNACLFNGIRFITPFGFRGALDARTRNKVYRSVFRIDNYKSNVLDKFNVYDEVFFWRFNGSAKVCHYGEHLVLNNWRRLKGANFR